MCSYSSDFDEFIDSIVIPKNTTKISRNIKTSTATIFSCEGMIIQRSMYRLFEKNSETIIEFLFYKKIQFIKFLRKFFSIFYSHVELS